MFLVSRGVLGLVGYSCDDRIPFQSCCVRNSIILSLNQDRDELGDNFHYQ